uniref:Uncharacterized protein n=1 Tax=Opuntia streptacantha TaxID=393608 RepID=A0A7C9F855_OPUST
MVHLVKAKDTKPHRIPSKRYSGSSLAERKSYTGTLNAGSAPRPTSDTTEAITALIMTIEVVDVSDTAESADGHKTDSTAKKQPATVALNPEASPAADPAATRGTFLLVAPNKLAMPLAIEEPISTLGPSGPNEFPVPRVIHAATVFKNG